MTFSWESFWPEALARSAPDAVPALTSLWPALVLLGVVLAWPTVRRWARALVTVVHEGGHALVGVLVGRRFLGFVVDRDLGGHAVTAGPTRGPGRIATTWAGYPAPALLGAGLVAAALRGWAGPVLVGAPIVLLVLLVMSRSLRTGALVVLVLAAAAALWWFGGAWRDGALAGIGLALLLGAWDSLGDVARSRDGAQDHRTLASLTPLPAGLWLATWFLVDAAATAAALWAAWAAWSVEALR